MTAEMWWAGLLQGAVGALVATGLTLAGAVWALRRTIAHERELSQEQAALETQRRADERTASAVATVVTAAHRGRRTPHDVEEMMSAMEVFVALELRDHEPVARWLRNEARLCEKLARERSNPKWAEATIWQLGHLVGTLTSWRAGRLADEDFETLIAEQLRQDPDLADVRVAPR
jgi:hypothetical protein